MNILITGVAGFVGMSLAEKLLNLGLHVYGIDNLNDYYDIELKKNRLALLNKFSNFNFIKSDIKIRSEIDSFFSENLDIDLVVHLAAQAGVRYSLDNPGEYIQSNIVGFFNVLDNCKIHKINNIIYASSSSVYGNKSSTPFYESDNCNQPISLYAASKMSNELIAHSYSHLYKLNIIGLRFFTVYGPWGRPDMAPWIFTSKIFNDEYINIFNNGDMLRDFTYIDDITESVYKLIDVMTTQTITTHQNEIYNIGSNNPIKLNIFIQLLEETIGKKAKKMYKQIQPGDVLKTYASVDKLYKKINFKPQYNIELGLRKWVDWYQRYIK